MKIEYTWDEQMFVTPTNPGEAISAVKAISKAVQAGQRIYTINATNMATVLPNINQSPFVLNEITNAVNAGFEVITHTDVVSVPGWSGAGYIILDAETGDGVYKIESGGNGSWFLGYGFAFFLMSMLLFAVASTGGALVFAMASVVFSLSFSITLLIKSAITEMELGFGCFTNGFISGLIPLTFIPGLARALGLSLSISSYLSGYTSLPTPNACLFEGEI